ARDAGGSARGRGRDLARRYPANICGECHSHIAGCCAGDQERRILLLVDRADVIFHKDAVEEKSKRTSLGTGRLSIRERCASISILGNLAVVGSLAPGVY